MIRACNVCGAELGPWEASSCISCGHSAQSFYGMTNSDAGVMILEREDTPVTVYDIQRGIHREFGRIVHRESLTTSLSGDLRLCWAGRGLYGLYRHKLIPGPRNLAGIAAFFLYSHGSPLTIQQLSFVMKHVGYRYQDQSLRNALTFRSLVHRLSWNTYYVQNDGTTKAALLDLGLAPADDPLIDMVVRCRSFIQEGLAELARRIR